MQKTLADLYRDTISLKFETIYADDLVHSINEYVLRKEVDILALCTEDHGFLQQVFHKSVIKAVSAAASYPVLVFHS